MRDAPLARWILSETLAPANVLSLIALGAAFGLIGRRALLAALALFALGIGIGLLAEDRLLQLLYPIPGAATHLFLTGPITYLAAGLALVVSARWRAYTAPPAAFVFGAMAGLAVRLTAIRACVLAVALTLRGFWRAIGS